MRGTHSLEFEIKRCTKLLDDANKSIKKVDFMGTDFALFIFARNGAGINVIIPFISKTF